jgi:hypothetical protein
MFEGGEERTFIYGLLFFFFFTGRGSRFIELGTCGIRSTEDGKSRSVVMVSLGSNLRGHFLPRES